MQLILTLGLTLVFYTAGATADVVSEEELGFEKLKTTLEDNLINNTRNNVLYICDGNTCESDDCFNLPLVDKNGNTIKACPRGPRPSCFCEDNRCSCCIHIKLIWTSSEGEICTELFYNEADNRMRIGLKWNRLPLISSTFPLLTPSEEPKCAGLSFIGTEVCVHLSDMSIIAGKPHSCVQLTIKAFKKQVFTFKIGCFKVITALGEDLRTLNLLIPADSLNIATSEDINSS